MRKRSTVKKVSKKLSEKMPVMFPRMKVLADRIIKNNMVQEIEEPDTNDEKRANR